MKTIEIDDDVYELLRNKQVSFEETASSVLRRLIRSEKPSSTDPLTVAKPQVLSALTPNPILAQWEAIPGYASTRDAKSLFLLLLSWLHRNYPNTFEEVLNLGGRKRRYFARTEKELKDSGQSVSAARIPNTDFWVVTNNDTPKKKSILADAARSVRMETGDYVDLVNGLYDAFKKF